MIPSVAIIGSAWRTPLGDTLDAVIARLLAGERAVTTNPRYPTAGYACTLAAPILREPARTRDARFLRRMGGFGLEVAREALASSGCAPGPRVGLFAGVGGLRAHWDDMLAALLAQDDDGRDAWQRGLREVHPYWMLRHLSNNVHALASAELGVRGEGATFGGGNGGAQAIAAAARALADGAVDAALVVAYDTLLEPESLVDYGARRAVTLATEPALVAAPYSAQAAGFVPGEAAAAIVVVRVADARVTHARVTVADGADGEPREPALATLRGVIAALDDAALVDGAARAWPELDTGEREVLASRFGHDTVLMSIAAATGRLGAATAVVQAIALGELLRRGSVPPIAGLAHAADGPCRPSVHAAPTAARVAVALSTATPGLVGAIRVELA